MCVFQRFSVFFSVNEVLKLITLHAVSQIVLLFFADWHVFFLSRQRSESAGERAVGRTLVWKIVRASFWYFNRLPARGWGRSFAPFRESNFSLQLTFYNAGQSFHALVSGGLFPAPLAAFPLPAMLRLIFYGIVRTRKTTRLPHAGVSWLFFWGEGRCAKNLVLWVVKNMLWPSERKWLCVK